MGCTGWCMIPPGLISGPSPGPGPGPQPSNFRLNLINKECADDGNTKYLRFEFHVTGTYVAPLNTTFRSMRTEYIQNTTNAGRFEYKIVDRNSDIFFVTIKPLDTTFPTCDNIDQTVNPSFEVITADDTGASRNYAYLI